MRKKYLSPESEAVFFRLERSFCDSYKSNGIEDYNLRSDIDPDWDD